MSRIAKFFFDYQKNAISHRERTLQSLEHAFEAADIEFPREKISEGKLPFAEFSSWLARKFGKSKRGLHGCWPRYDGNCWRIIKENVPSEEGRYDLFFEWFKEFRKMSAHRCRVVEFPATNENPMDRIQRIEVWACLPDSGFLKYLVFADGFERPDGFCSSLDDMFHAVKQEYGIELDQWTCV